jgi:hypothetical protein
VRARRGTLREFPPFACGIDTAAAAAPVPADAPSHGGTGEGSAAPAALRGGAAVSAMPRPARPEFGTPPPSRRGELRACPAAYVQAAQARRPFPSSIPRELVHTPGKTACTTAFLPPSPIPFKQEAARYC